MSRVALIGENSVEYVNALLDIWNNGDAAVLIDWRIPISSAIEMMNEAGVTECHIENNIYEKYSSLKAENIVFKIFQSRFHQYNMRHILCSHYNHIPQHLYHA